MVRVVGIASTELKCKDRIARTGLLPVTKYMHNIFGFYGGSVQVFKCMAGIL